MAHLGPPPGSDIHSVLCRDYFIGMDVLDMTHVLTRYRRFAFRQYIANTLMLCDYACVWDDTLVLTRDVNTFSTFVALRHAM